MSRAWILEGCCEALIFVVGFVKKKKKMCWGLWICVHVYMIYD